MISYNQIGDKDMTLQKETGQPVRIAFFDIDGTLLPFRQTQLSPGHAEALRQLQKQGILVVAASGRPPYIIPDFGFDARIAFNGALAVTKDGEIAYENAIEQPLLAKVYRFLSDHGIGMILAGETSMGADRYDQKLQDYLSLASQKVIPDPGFMVRLSQPCLQVIAAVPGELREQMQREIPELEIFGWHPLGVDITSSGVSKGEALKAVCSRYGIPISQSIAFGDAMNDKELLEAAGIAVAMGNAQEDLKQIADTVTEPVEEDGIWTELKRRNLVS